MGMKQTLVMMVAVMLVGCETTKVDPKAPANIADPIFEERVRKSLKKPEGDLTEADLEKVTLLFLTGPKITDAGLRELAKLQNLTHLNLESTKITDAGLKEVAKLQNLTWLGLDATKVTDAGLKELAKLQKLRWLGLRHTQITDQGLKEVAKLQNLIFLSLNGTKVTKEGAAELKKALPNCKINFVVTSLKPVPTRKPLLKE